MGDSFRINKDLLAQMDPDNQREVQKIEIGQFMDGNMHIVFRFDDGSDVICRQDAETGLFNVLQIRMRDGSAMKVEGIIDVPVALWTFLTPGEKLLIGIIPPDEEL